MDKSIPGEHRGCANDKLFNWRKGGVWELQGGGTERGGCRGKLNSRPMICTKQLPDSHLPQASRHEMQTSFN